MPIYKITESGIESIERTTFDKSGVRERQDLQQLLKTQIEVIAPDALVVAEEFGEWEDSRRRIDLLAIDKRANLVVIELKRTEDGGHMELQALRYAAMISTLTFEKLVQTYSEYLDANNINLDANESLLEFLEWAEADEDQFGQEVKIILASAEFSRELTTAVMWLNDFGIDIRCVRMHPYLNGSELLVDVQTVIPIPEVADYQVRIREKKQKERESRTSNRDLSKYDIEVNGVEFYSMNKRWMIYEIVHGVVRSGGTPVEIQQVADDKMPVNKKLFEIFEGTLNEEQVTESIMANDPGGKRPRHKRYFCEEGQFFYFENRTYVLTNQWGKFTPLLAEALKEHFPSANIEIRLAS